MISIFCLFIFFYLIIQAITPIKPQTAIIGSNGGNAIQSTMNNPRNKI